MFMFHRLSACKKRSCAVPKWLNRSIWSSTAFIRISYGRIQGKMELPWLPSQKRAPRRIDSWSVGHINIRMWILWSTWHSDFPTEAETSGERDGSGTRTWDTSSSVGCKWRNILAFIVDDGRPSYGKDTDTRKWHNQLELLPDICVSASHKSDDKVTTVCQLAELMDKEQINSPTMLMSEINTLLWIYYTIPVTSVTAERTFSAMCGLKSYMRATMTQKRVNNVMLMHCHKDWVDARELISVARLLQVPMARCQKYFSSF